MQKIPTLFERDFSPASKGRFVSDRITFGCAWVLAGIGTPTRKFDGACIKLGRGRRWWVRREVKLGKAAPQGFEPISTDPETGKTVGWEPAGNSGFRDILAEAVATTEARGMDFEPGTYELIGPRVNGNPERIEAHILVPHGRHVLAIDPVELHFTGIREWLFAHPGVEGIVFWRDLSNPVAGLAKIKARDFRR